MQCPICNKSDKTIKVGIRETSKGKVKKVLCRRCGRYFSSSVHPYSRYPDQMIFESMELYNLGRSIPFIRNRMNERFDLDPPRRTLYSWIRRYEKEFGMYALRGHREDDGFNPIRTFNLPDGNLWQYHSVKLDEMRVRWQKLFSHIKRIEVRDPAFLHFRNTYDMEESDKIDPFSIKPDRKFGKLIRLARRVKGNMSHNDMKEFFLLHQPECLATNLPIPLNNRSNSSSVLHEINAVDMVMVDQDHIDLMDIVDDREEMVQRIPLVLRSRKKIIEDTRIDPSRISASFLSGDMSYGIPLNDAQS